MKTYNFDGYTLTMQATSKRDSYNHVMIAYEFKTPQGTTLFEGSDFGASPLHTPEGEKSAKALLGFLTLKKGDTDEEYFANYTPEQIAFSESMECENLQIYAMDE